MLPILKCLLPASLLLWLPPLAAAPEESLPDWQQLLVEPAHPLLTELEAALQEAFAVDAKYRQTRWLHEVARQPGETLRLLQDLDPRAHLATNSPQQLSAALLADYRDSYSLSGQACEAPTLPLPRTLEVAAAQITDLAARLTDDYDIALSGRAGQRLREHHGEAMALMLSHPAGGGMSRRQHRAMRRYLGALGEIDGELPACALARWSTLLDPAWLARLHQLMTDSPNSQAPIIARYPTPHGQILFAGGSADRHLLETPLFLADLGGDDFYGLAPAEPFAGAPQLLIDFAGDDRYESASAGVYGAGIGAVSVLLDVAGNDSYQTQSLSQATAVLGAGLLIDSTGDDRYVASHLAQGTALFGLALLADSSGQDNYRLGALGQGLGLPAGLALLLDREGGDAYTAHGLIPTNYGTPGLTDAWAQGVGVGIRGLAPGGMGLLLDGAGADDYDAGTFAQGGGYFYGTGIQLDLGTDDDRYFGTRYNFGWGAHMGMGWFEDAGGDDHYRTRQIVAAGLAWDLSVAAFLDHSGDDVYELGDFSFGAAAHRSMALFYDGGGEDRYAGTAPARANEGPPNVSLFLDRGPEANRFQPDPSPGCHIDESVSLRLIDSVTPGGSSACLPVTRP